MAKLTIFLILVAGSRNLAEMSEGFCAELCEALRRKDLHDSFNNGRYRPRVEQPQQPLNPLWVAAALYYRVVCGLLDLEASSPITKIFGSLETQLVDIRGSLWSILKYVAIDNAHNGKGTPKKTLIDQFPMLSFTRHFDLAFWLGPIIPSDEVAPPTVLKRQGDPFAEQGYDMASFLQDDVHHPSFLPSTPLPVQQVPGLTRSVQSNQRSVSDSMSLSETSNAPSTDSSLDPKDLCTILDPLEPTPWELMGSIDSIYSDFDDSE